MGYIEDRIVHHGNTNYSIRDPEKEKTLNYWKQTLQYCTNDPWDRFSWIPGTRAWQDGYHINSHRYTALLTGVYYWDVINHTLSVLGVLWSPFLGHGEWHCGCATCCGHPFWVTGSDSVALLHAVVTLFGSREWHCSCATCCGHPFWGSNTVVVLHAVVTLLGSWGATFLNDGSVAVAMLGDVVIYFGTRGVTGCAKCCVQHFGIKGWMCGYATSCGHCCGSRGVTGCATCCCHLFWVEESDYGYAPSYVTLFWSRGVTTDSYIMLHAVVTFFYQREWLYVARCGELLGPRSVPCLPNQLLHPTTNHGYLLKSLHNFFNDVSMQYGGQVAPLHPTPRLMMGSNLLFTNDIKHRLLYLLTTQ
jgi:hypothetical protein